MCQLILGKYEESCRSFLLLIKLRHKLYTVAGCYQVDYKKLLHDLYSKLGYVYEEQGQDTAALAVYE